MIPNMIASDGGFAGWVAVFSCFYHHAFVSSAVYGLSVYYGAWIEEFDTGRGIVSWMLTLGVAFSMATGPVTSSLCTKFGHRKVIIAGSAICAMGFFITSFVKSIYAVVFLIGGLSGFGLGLQYLPSVAMIPFYFNKRRSLAVGIAISGAGVGVFLYPPFLIWLEEQYTWRGAMMILSGISLNQIVCASLLNPVNDTVRNGGYTHPDVDEPCTRSKNESLTPKSLAEETQDFNGSTSKCKSQRFSSKELYELVDSSSVNDMSREKYSSVIYEEPCDPIQSHLVSSRQSMNDTGSNKSLRLSHIDIVLSTSHFDLAEADRKRAKSLVHVLKPGSRCLQGKYIELLRNPIYFSVAFSFFLICLTALVPVAYIVDRAEENGVDKTKAALALSMYGAGNLFGRVALGVLADLGLDSLLLCAANTMVIGISTCLSPWCGTNAILHSFYGLTFGTCMGGSVTLTPLILVDLFGLNMLNRSYGLLLVFLATGFVVGTPIAGWVFDATKSYTIPFIFHGAIVVVAALILVSIKVAVVRSPKQAAAAAVNATLTPNDNKVHVEDMNTETVSADVHHEKECILKSQNNSDSVEFVLEKIYNTNSSNEINKKSGHETHLNGRPRSCQDNL